MKPECKHTCKRTDTFSNNAGLVSQKDTCLDCGDVKISNPKAEKSKECDDTRCAAAFQCVHEDKPQEPTADRVSPDVTIEKDSKIELGWEAEFDKEFVVEIKSGLSTKYYVGYRHEDSIRSFAPDGLKAFISNLLKQEREKFIEAASDLATKHWPIDSKYDREIHLKFYVALKKLKDS